MGAPTLVADDFFAAGCVLGKAVWCAPRRRTLASRSRAAPIVNGKEAGRGTGADVLGHPHNALAWLANHLAEEGKGLHAGQIVLTGSLVKTVWLDAGDSVKMELDGLGTVEAKFGVKPRRSVGWAKPTGRANARPMTGLRVPPIPDNAFDRWWALREAVPLPTPRSVIA